MPFWPFRKSEPEQLTATELRDKLIEAAASGSGRKLRSLCKQYKTQVAEHMDVICKIPDGMLTDDRSIDQYFPKLAAVAQCLAHECGEPELWNKLCGDPADNPLMQMDHWYGEMPQRMERLEYEELIAEAKGFIGKVKSLRGGPARLNECYLNARLGQLLFHCGRVNEAIEPFSAALAICIENDDVEGQVAYLSSLLEVHRYLDDGHVVETAEQLLAARRRGGLPTEDIEKQLELLHKGEPLCRIVCLHDGRELELDEVNSLGEGRYQFLFRRNRISLQKATTLTSQGNELASSGQYAAALEKYHEASDIDPYDPDPVYQSGMCLIELGAYAKAREAFEEVERLAPGWFRCRADRWMADGLDQGTISNEEYLLVRTLDDGGLSDQEARSLVIQGVERCPDFAPLYLFLGNLCENEADCIATYRKGLELVEEPDLESRLLCALAGRLPPESPERKTLVERAVALKGSLVALASAKLMRLQ
ncbi:tetratricopeptide repeat protein [Stieleria varia]|uniref:Tetratricopeptide repeat protein n=1 Tax=Stieleria varia TaxID=2528005 RepID=A0A5C6AY15_9BACT|nr:tetratricopeptide repeat protein [Stieleria varia]TWU04518.1 Tetratricopeptide repeat protein [Stieleria varia]